MRKYWWCALILIAFGLWVLWPRSEASEKVEEIVVKNEIKVKKPVSKVAIVADIHNDLASLDKAIQIAKSEAVQTIIVAGDMTINGTRDELLHVLAHLGDSGIKYYVVPGNHDLYKNAFAGVFGKDFQSLKLGGVKFILIDNGSWRGLGGEQKRWIESEVAECLVIRCVAVMHMPLLNNFSKHIMGENSEAVTAEGAWLLKLLKDNKVKMGYSGHLHYSSDYEIDGWETVLVGAISKDRNTQTPRFTKVTLYDDGTIENNVKLVL